MFSQETTDVLPRDINQITPSPQIVREMKLLPTLEEINQSKETTIPTMVPTPEDLPTIITIRVILVFREFLPIMKSMFESNFSTNYRK